LTTAEFIASAERWKLCFFSFVKIISLNQALQVNEENVSPPTECFR